MDIVERLRKWCSDPWPKTAIEYDIKEAADEIASLRAQLAERRRRMEVMYGWLKIQGQLRDDCPGPKFFLTYPEARDWFNEDTERANRPKHRCGVHGFDPMQGDVCPACKAGE